MTNIAEHHGWRLDPRKNPTSTSKGLVSNWLRERRIPMHPRTRRVTVDDLLLAAATPGRLQPTSAHRLRRHAMEGQQKLTETILSLRNAVQRLETQQEALAVAYERLEDNLESLRQQLADAEAEEQRLYDAGDQRNTFTRLDPMAGFSAEKLGVTGPSTE